ncbi:MAG: hypothetical protein U0930_17455 [Pirellulales bacterium]
MMRLTEAGFAIEIGNSHCLAVFDGSHIAKWCKSLNFDEDTTAQEVVRNVFLYHDEEIVWRVQNHPRLDYAQRS